MTPSSDPIRIEAMFVRMLFLHGIFLLFFSFGIQAKESKSVTEKAFPLLGFFQNGKVVIPSFQDKSSSALPLEMYAWVMLPRETEPKPADLKAMGPFKILYESKLERKDLSTIAGEKWLVPQGAKSAVLYRFASLPSPVESAGAPMLLFDQDLKLMPDYQKRSVAYSDQEYIEELGFRSVERSYDVMWPTLNSDDRVFRLMELPNGSGHSFFLNRLSGLECEKTIPFDFYNQSKNQEAADFEMMAAACGDLDFQ
jgi:hypothetical protein